MLRVKIEVPQTTWDRNINVECAAAILISGAICSAPFIAFQLAGRLGYRKHPVGFLDIFMID
jgi:hypothetical protein